MIEIRHAGMQTTDATRDAYDQVYAGPGIMLRDSFYLWLISLLDPQPGKLLLDISCGEGRLVNLASQQGVHGVGMDFSWQGVLKGKRAWQASEFSVADGECLPLAPASFDYVTHIGSLEHYQNPQAGANEIGRTLKPGGRAVIMLPNTFGLLHIRYVWRHGDVFDDGQPLQRYGARKTWERILIDGGLTVQKTLGYGGVAKPRTPADRSWLLRRPNKVLRMVVGKLTPVNLASHFVYVCTRA